MRLASGKPTASRLIRNCAIATTIICLALPLVTGPGCSPAVAQQTKPAPPAQPKPHKEVFHVEQIPLTERQVQGAIAAAPGVKETTEAAQEGINELRPETVAKLDAVAREHGLASYEEFLLVWNNLSLVGSGFDDMGRKYIGRAARTKLEIAKIKADTKMSAEDKRDALDALDFESPAPRFKANIDLFAKYYDRVRGLDVELSPGFSH
jgi:hypothetical protein